MDPNVRDLAHPSVQMRLEGREAFERASCDGIPLHIPHPALVLALGARPVGSAGPRPEAPVPSEGQELRVERDLARRHLVAAHEPAVNGHRSLRDWGPPKYPTLAGWRLW